MRLACGGRAGDRLHYDDGTPRGTARSTNGRELNWFDAHGPCPTPYVEHLDPQDWSFDVITAKHDDMKGGGLYPTVRSRITISRTAFPHWALAAETAGCLAAAVHGGMPINILERY